MTGGLQSREDADPRGDFKAGRTLTRGMTGLARGMTGSLADGKNEILRGASQAALEAGKTQKLAKREMLMHEKLLRWSRSARSGVSEEAHTCFRNCLRVVFLLLVACAVPLIEALKAVGFRWAEQGNVEFSTIAPLIFGCTFLGLTFFLTLLLRHGLREVRELADRRYLGFAVPSVFRTGLFVGANWALWHGTSATVLVMVMKSSLIPGILGEMWLTSKKPWITQLWTIGAIMLCIVNYTLSAMDSDMVLSNKGLIWSVMAAQCDFIGGLTLEAGIRLRLKRRWLVNKEAEKIRCQLVNEIFKLPVYVVLLFIFEYDFVESGIVRGWNVQIIVGAVVTIPFYVAIYNYSCIANGTLQTNIFSSVDIGLTCILEYFIFNDSITANQGLLIAVITLLILTYSTLVIDLRRHALDVVREYSSRSCRNSTDSSPTSSRQMEESRSTNAI